MTSSSINLVSNKILKLENEQKRLRLFKIVAVASLVFVASASIILFIITLALPISSVKKDQEQTLSSISALRKQLVKYVLIKDRVKNISEFMSSRKNYASSANTIFEKLPQELSVETMILEDKILTLSVSGDSLIPVNEFIDDLVEIGDSGKIIKNLTIQSLVLNFSNGRYILSMQADIL